MLLDMLTADTPTKHGHDAHAHPAASPSASPSPPHRLPSPANACHGALALAQMPLSLLGSVLRYQAQSPTPSTRDDDDADAPTKHAADAAAATATPMAAPTAAPIAAPHRPPAHAHADSLAPARPVSSGSSAVTDEQPRKKAPRPKTSFVVARPPPAVHPLSKLHLRPKVQLQLLQVQPAARPKPVYEVIPVSLLAPRSTRRLARAFNTRDRLGPADLLVVKAAAYGHAADDDATSDDERWGSRDVIAVICPGKTERGHVVSHTEICMDDGASRWEATPMPNGAFDFTSPGEHGLTTKARWVPKPPASRRISSQSLRSQPSLPSPGLPPARDDAKWNFSTISTHSRRHPVIASMTRTRIDVNDSYLMPSATQPSTPSGHGSASPALTPASIDAASFLDAAADRLPIQTDEALRRFIVVSGIWVSSLHETYDHVGLPLCPSFNLSGTIRPTVGRTVSMSFLDSPRSASPASADDDQKSIHKLLRNASHRLHRHASFSTEPPPSPMSARMAPSSPAVKTRSRRAHSTGAHTLYSMTGSLKKRYGVPSQVETLSETEEDKENRRSAETLRTKQLAQIEMAPAETLATAAPPRPPVLVIPVPNVIRPSTDGPSSPLLLPSPQFPDSDRSRKTQSAFNPITTAGMWDSGVTDGPGLQRRPTSMFVMNERKRKEEKKRGRSEGRTAKQEREAMDRSTSIEDLKKINKETDCTGMRRRLKNSLKGMFGRREKA